MAAQSQPAGAGHGGGHGAGKGQLGAASELRVSQWGQGQPRSQELEGGWQRDFVSTHTGASLGTDVPHSWMRKLRLSEPVADPWAPRLWFRLNRI